MLFGPMLNQQLFELPAGAARLEPDLQERIPTFESLDKLRGPIAGHRGIPYDLTLFARLFLQNFGASLVTHPVDLFQSFFNGSCLGNHEAKQHECHHNCRPESHFFTVLVCHQSMELIKKGRGDFSMHPIASINPRPCCRSSCPPDRPKSLFLLSLAFLRPKYFPGCRWCRPCALEASA